MRGWEDLGDSCLTSFVPFCLQAVEFHEDLFPDTAGCVPASEPHAWWAGSNQQVEPRPGWPPPASTKPPQALLAAASSMALQSSYALTKLP